MMSNPHKKETANFQPSALTFMYKVIEAARSMADVVLFVVRFNCFRQDL